MEHKAKLHTQQSTDNLQGFVQHCGCVSADIITRNCTMMHESGFHLLAVVLRKYWSWASARGLQGLEG